MVAKETSDLLLQGQPGFFRERQQPGSTICLSDNHAFFNAANSTKVYIGFGKGFLGRKIKRAGNTVSAHIALAGDGNPG